MMRVRIGVLGCLLLMASAAAAFAYWGATWESLLLLALSIGCLASIIYGWMLARRTNRELDRIIRRGPKQDKTFRQGD